MLSVCSSCQRHTRGTACAFCGASVRRPEVARTSRGSRAALFASVAVVGLACGARTELGGEEEETPIVDAHADCHPPMTVYGGPFNRDAACAKAVIIEDAGPNE